MERCRDTVVGLGQMQQNNLTFVGSVCCRARRGFLAGACIEGSRSTRITGLPGPELAQHIGNLKVLPAREQIIDLPSSWHQALQGAAQRCVHAALIRATLALPK